MSSAGIRVLRLFSRLNIGGPSFHVILLSAGLSARGYETRLVIGHESDREGNLLDLAAEKGVRCERLAGLGREIQPLSDLKALWGLYRIVREFRPHIVHTHTAKAGVLGRIAALLGRAPVVVHTYHGHVLSGYFGRVKSALYRFIETRLARRSHALITVSERVAEELAALGVAPRERFRVVPLGLDLDRFSDTLPRGILRREAGFPDDAALVGIVGRLVPIKNVDAFMEAAATAGSEFPEARFSIVGDGEERLRLEERARELGIQGRVHFHGWKRDMRQVLGDLDLVVNCSRNEGTPVALIEALAAGRPVVATRVGGTAEVLCGGAHGTLVPAGDTPAIAAAIAAALRDPDSLRRKALAARGAVLQRFACERLVGDIDALYRELLAARAA